MFKHKGQGVSCRVDIFSRASVLKGQGLLLLTDLLDLFSCHDCEYSQTEASIIIWMITPNTFISCLVGLILTLALNRLWTQPKRHVIFMAGFISSECNFSGLVTKSNPLWLWLHMLHRPLEYGRWLGGLFLLYFMGFGPTNPFDFYLLCEVSTVVSAQAVWIWQYRNRDENILPGGKPKSNIPAWLSLLSGHLHIALLRQFPKCVSIRALMTYFVSFFSSSFPHRTIES